MAQLVGFSSNEDAALVEAELDGVRWSESGDRTPGADTLHGPVPASKLVPDLDEALLVEQSYASDMIKGVMRAVVVGLFLAAPIFRWFPATPDLGSGTIILPPALTAAALGVIGAMAIALQVAVRQSPGIEPAEEHLGRVSVIEYMALIAGLGAVILVAGDLSRLHSGNPYVFVILAEFAAGVFVAGVATDASLVTKRRYGNDLRDSRRRKRAAVIQAAIVRIEGESAGSVPDSIQRRRTLIDLLLISAMVLCLGFAAAGVERVAVWRSTLALGVLTLAAIELWQYVRTELLVGARMNAVVAACVASFALVTVMGVAVEATLDEVDTTAALGPRLVMIAIIFMGPVAPALWAHRTARIGWASIGDTLVLRSLNRRLRSLDCAAEPADRGGRGWATLTFAFLLPPIGMPCAQLVRRSEGVNASTKDRQIVRWAWVAGLAGILAWSGTLYVLWISYT